MRAAIDLPSDRREGPEDIHDVLSGRRASVWSGGEELQLQPREERRGKLSGELEGSGVWRWHFNPALWLASAISTLPYPTILFQVQSKET